MMKFIVYAAVVALLLGVANCVDEPNAACPLATDISCNAYSTLEIRVTGGKCEGEASANCEAVGTSQSKYTEAYKEWFGGEAGDTSSLCDSGKAEAAAESIATAIAEVWTSAQAKVKCEGYGTACGYSISGGTAFGLAMSEALAQAAADASVDGVADAFCFADVRAVSSAIASAAADATAAACVQDSGSLEDWQESYVKQVAKSIASAFAKATAGVCADTPGEVSAESKCTGKAESTTEEGKDVYVDGEGSRGDACGGIAQLKACTGEGGKKCCDSGFKRSLCTCKNCNGPWVKKTKGGDLKKIFQDKKKTLCFCEDTSDEGGDEEDPKSDEEGPVDVVDTPDETTDEQRSEDGDGEQKTEEGGDDEQKTDEGGDGDDEQKTEEGGEGEQAEEQTGGGDDEQKTEEGGDGEQAEEQTGGGDDEQNTGEGGEVADKRCEGAPETSCSAYSTLNIKVTAGSCEGESAANCDSYSSATNQFDQSFNEWWKDEASVCDKGTADATATAVAEAIANVWTEATSTVTCTGQGYACGWSAGSGKAWAAAFAEAVAQAAADASDPSGAAEAFCFADVRATSAAIATAAADAQSEACTTGGTVESYQKAFASTVATAIATAFASATAETCNSGDEVKASSLCKGKATSDVEKDEFKYGSACAGASQAKACTGRKFKECCGKSYRRRFCQCKDDGCEGGTWLRATNYDEKKNTKRSFKSKESADTCFCDE